MTGVDIFTLAVFWHIIGSLVIGMHSNYGVLKAAIGLEFFNPCFIYKHAHVNWFGAIMLTIFYNVLLPVCSVCYWFYVLCTVGRKY